MQPPNEFSNCLPFIDISPLAMRLLHTGENGKPSSRDIDNQASRVTHKILHVYLALKKNKTSISSLP